MHNRLDMFTSLSLKKQALVVSMFGAVLIPVFAMINEFDSTKMGVVLSQTENAIVNPYAGAK